MFLKFDKDFCDRNTKFWIVKHTLIALAVSVAVIHFVEFHIYRTQWQKSNEKLTYDQIIDETFVDLAKKLPKFRLLISIVIPAILHKFSST